MKETIVIVLSIVAVFGIIGYMNASDIQDCVERGNSLAVCQHTFNR